MCGCGAQRSSGRGAPRRDRRDQKWSVLLVGRAAAAIAGLVGPDELNEEYIVPGLFDRRVAAAVAQATREAAWSSGVARRTPSAEMDERV